MIVQSLSQLNDIKGLTTRIGITAKFQILSADQTMNAD
jgi:hypothetical protein